MNQIRTKKTFAAAAGILAIGITIAWVYFSHEEPKYQGKSLSEWLVDYENATDLENDVSVKEAQATAASAIRHIGTNSLPFLLEWIKKEPDLMEKIKFRLNRDFVSVRTVRAYRARTGFEILGTNAVPAIPALTNIVLTSRRLDVAIHASLALGLLGNPGTMALINMATNSTVFHRSSVVASLQFATNGGVDVLPILENCLNDSDKKIRRTATNVLQKIKPELLTRPSKNK